MNLRFFARRAKFRIEKQYQDTQCGGALQTTHRRNAESRPASLHRSRTAAPGRARGLALPRNLQGCHSGVSVSFLFLPGFSFFFVFFLIFFETPRLRSQKSSKVNIWAISASGIPAGVVEIFPSLEMNFLKSRPRI